MLLCFLLFYFFIIPCCCLVFLFPFIVLSLLIPCCCSVLFPFTLYLLLITCCCSVLFPYNSFSLYFLVLDVSPVFRCFCFQFSPVFQFSSVSVSKPSFDPVFKYSLFLFPNVSVFKFLLFSDVPVFQCSCFPAFLCFCFRSTCFQRFLFSSVPVFQCSCFPVFLCFCFRSLVFRCSCFPVFLFLCSCCLNAEARRSRLCWLVLKRFDHGVISGRRPGIVWSKATFRYALTIWDRTETPGIPRLVLKTDRRKKIGLYCSSGFCL